MEKRSVLLVCTIFILANTNCSSSINLTELVTPENEELVNVLKEELDLFRIEMTKSFMEAHSRRKRGLVSDLDINNDKFLEIPDRKSVGPFSTFIFNKDLYMIKDDGIYRMNDLSFLAAKRLDATQNFNSEKLTQVGSWKLKENEIVLHGYPWRNKFLFFTTQGLFSEIYTIHADSFQPVFRQRIYNDGTVTSAQFFDYRRKLYLVFSVDNEHHTTSDSKIYRWQDSYMDAIHTIQTSGASAVTAFTINSKNYIAIAQSRDSSGNRLVGTILLSMDPSEKLQRTQLLWSKGAVSLQYITTEKEHFLLIGQEEESSIMYWFGGMDFLFWQSLDGLQGNNLVMDGIQMSADEPMIIASDGTLLKFFSRAVSASELKSNWVQSKFVDLKKSDFRITQAKFLTMDDDNTYLAITRQRVGSNTESLRVYKVNLFKRELTVTTAQEKGDTLSQCMHSLSMSLSEAKPILARIEEKRQTVLTTNGNWNFQGVLVSDKIIKSDSTKSKIATAQITPELQRAGPSDRFKQAPSQLFSSIQNRNVQLDSLKSDLNNIMFKSSRPNTITGKLKFTDVQFNNLQAPRPTDLKVDVLNNVQWSDISNSALRLTSPEPQQVNAEWKTESLVTGETFIEDSPLSPTNFIRKTCSDGESQSVTGMNQFNDNIRVLNGMNLGPTVTINEIPFSDVVLKQNKHQKVSGFKHAENVKGDFIVEKVNHKQLESWFLDVAKLSSSTAQEFTGPIKFMEDAALKIDQIKLENLNSVPWDQFKQNVLLDAVPQHIKGSVNFENVRVDNLKANAISSTQSQDMLTANSDQEILSKLTVENLRINGPLTSKTTNGVHLSDAVNRNDQQVVINGPVTLDSCRVEHVFISDDKTIAGKDVSSLKNFEKTHIYTTVDDAPIVLRNLNVKDLDTELINEAHVADFKTKYWSKSKNNVVNLQELVLSDKSVFVENEDFRTHTVNGFSFPTDFIPLNQDEIEINTKLNFAKSVTSLEDVTIPHGKTINKIDMSEVQSMIVDENFEGVIKGEKTFTFPVVATGGAWFGKLNDMDLLTDPLMLTTLDTQEIVGAVTFDNDVIMDHLKVTQGNVDVQGFVNQVNLENVKDTTAYKNGANDVQGDLIFNKPVNAHQFSTGKLNEVDLFEITENMVFLNEEEIQSFDSEMLVTNGQIDFLDDSHANQINGIDVSNYLSQVVRLDQKRSTLIEGKKMFKDVSLQDQLMCTDLNGVNMKNLEANALSKTKSQVLEGMWRVGNVHFKENLETREIGGILLDNVMHTDQPFEVVSPVKFTSHRTRIEGPLSVAGTINGVAFDENMQQFVSIDSPTNFEQVLINGNLAWGKSFPDAQRLSYLFDTAVTPFGPQTISSDVNFAGGFTSSKILSSKWLNDIDLQAVNDDALLTDDINWALSGNNRFVQLLQIDNLAKPVEVLDIKEINNVNMQTISDEIVRNTDDFSDGRVIRGMKEFNNDITLSDLNIRDAISEVPMSELVVKNDQREINTVQFANLIVQEDLDFKSSSGMNLQSMLNDRVTLSKQQELQGAYSFENVDATRQCDIQQINGITLENTLKRGGRQLTPISGTKVFKHGLTVDGDLNTPSLNNHNVNELVTNTLRVDRPEVVKRPVVFESPVVVNKRMDADSVNGVNFQNFDKDISKRIGRLMNEAEGPDVLAADLSMRTKQLQLFSQQRSVWLEYFVLKQDLTELGPKSRVNHVKTSNNGDILVTFHHSSDGQDAGLPKGCQCNSVDTISINDLREHKTQLVGTRSCVQIFHVTSPTGRGYTVKSETPSNNIKCVTDADKTTNIFLDKTLIADLDMGHVSDVGVFTDGGLDYLICAQYFDKNSLSHSTTTKVLRVDNGKVLEVQNIETHGAKKVALEVINDRWMLAIANSKNSLDETSCNAESAIYAWSPKDSKFELLRTIMTMGAHDVQFITSDTHGGSVQENFVALAQEGSSASGEVIIYRFEQLGGNFEAFQTIRSEWPLTSLKSIWTCSKSFLVTVVPQKGMTLHDMRCVEGFQEYLTVPIFGATDVSTFTLDGMQIFAIATAKGPILAEAVMAAPCLN